MKKIKLAIMSVAILLGAGGAIASNTSVDCTLNPQYYLANGAYMAAGVFGTDYTCDTGSSACTFYISGGQYVQCRIGSFLSAKAAKKDQQKK